MGEVGREDEGRGGEAFLYPQVTHVILRLLVDKTMNAPSLPFLPPSSSLSPLTSPPHTRKKVQFAGGGANASVHARTYHTRTHPRTLTLTHTQFCSPFLSF